MTNKTKSRDPDDGVTIHVTNNGDCGAITTSASKTEPTFFEKTVEYLYLLSFLSSRIAPLAGTHETAGDAILEQNGRWSIIEFKQTEKDIKSELAKYVPQSLKKAKTSALRKLNRAAKAEGFADYANALANYARMSEKLHALFDDYSKASKAYEKEVVAQKPRALESLLEGFRKIEELFRDGEEPPKSEQVFFEPHFFVYAHVDGEPTKWAIGLQAQHYLGSWIDETRTTPRYANVEHLDDLGCSHEAFMYYLGVLIEAKTGNTASDGSAGLIEYGTIVAVSDDHMKVMTFNEFVDSYGYYSSNELEAKLVEKQKIIAQAQADTAALKTAMSQRGLADVQSDTSKGKVFKPKQT